MNSLEQPKYGQVSTKKERKKNKVNWLTWNSLYKRISARVGALKAPTERPNEKCESHYFKNKLLDLVSNEWKWERKQNEHSHKWNTNAYKIYLFIFALWSLCFAGVVFFPLIFFLFSLRLSNCLLTFCEKSLIKFWMV